MVSINQYIVTTLSGIGLPVSDGLYQGRATEYIYFVVADDRGGDFGNDRALSDEYSVQIHYVCPWQDSYTEKKALIREALEDAGFTYPAVINLSDSSNKIRHLCFECEISSDDFDS